LLGSNEKLKVDVIVQNEGEDSFETTFDMTVPAGVNYVKIERIDDFENDIPVQCSAPSAMTNNTLHCDIGNPLPKDKYVSPRPDDVAASDPRLITVSCDFRSSSKSFWNRTKPPRRTLDTNSTWR